MAALAKPFLAFRGLPVRRGCGIPVLSSTDFTAAAATTTPATVCYCKSKCPYSGVHLQCAAGLANVGQRQGWWWRRCLYSSSRSSRIRRRRSSSSSGNCSGGGGAGRGNAVGGAPPACAAAWGAGLGHGGEIVALLNKLEVSLLPLQLLLVPLLLRRGEGQQGGGGASGAGGRAW